MTQVLTVLRRTEGAKDAHGNKAVTYPPADWTVSSIAPGARAEDGSQNRDRRDIAWTVYAWDNAELPTALDRVTFNGKTYEVNGDPMPYTFGPWGSAAGTPNTVVELKRMEG